MTARERAERWSGRTFAFNSDFTTLLEREFQSAIDEAVERAAMVAHEAIAARGEIGFTGRMAKAVANEIRALKQPAKDGSTKNTRSRKDGDDGT
jgi:hypothetical protein